VTIVGVVNDTRDYGAVRRAHPIVAREVDPRQPGSRIRTLDAIRRHSIALPFPPLLPVESVPCPVSN
jgi:hypothetical protein